MAIDKFFRERRKWQNPEALLFSIGLKRGFTFIDVGCGTGFFAIPAAIIVGENGRVYGLDPDSEAIDELRKEARKKGLQNLNLRVGTAEETVLCKSCAHIVFFSIVLHDFNDTTKVLRNAKKMLKYTGRLVNLDWKKEPMELGLPLERRFSEKKAEDIIESASFEIETIKEVSHYFYLIIAKHGTICS